MSEVVHDFIPCDIKIDYINFLQWISKFMVTDKKNIF